MQAQIIPFPIWPELYRRAFDLPLRGWPYEDKPLEPARVIEIVVTRMKG